MAAQRPDWETLRPSYRDCGAEAASEDVPQARYHAGFKVRAGSSPTSARDKAYKANFLDRATTSSASTPSCFPGRTTWPRQARKRTISPSFWRRLWGWSWFRGSWADLAELGQIGSPAPRLTPAPEHRVTVQPRAPSDNAGKNPSDGRPSGEALINRLPISCPSQPI